MASETVDVEEQRETPKWGENIKMYGRRNRGKALKDKSKSDNDKGNNENDVPAKNSNTDAANIAITPFPVADGKYGSAKENNENVVTAENSIGDAVNVAISPTRVTDEKDGSEKENNENVVTAENSIGDAVNVAISPIRVTDEKDGSERENNENVVTAENSIGETVNVAISPTRVTNEKDGSERENNENVVTAENSIGDAVNVVISPTRVTDENDGSETENNENVVTAENSIGDAVNVAISPTRVTDEKDGSEKENNENVVSAENSIGAAVNVAISPTRMTDEKDGSENENNENVVTAENSSNDSADVAITPLRLADGKNGNEEINEKSDTILQEPPQTPATKEVDSNTANVTIITPSRVTDGKDGNEEGTKEKSDTVPQESPQMLTTEEANPNTAHVVTPCRVPNGNDGNEKETNERSYTVCQESSKSFATEKANLVQQVLEVGTEVVIQDKQPEVHAPNGSVRANGIGDFVRKVDNRVRINLKSGRPKNEIRELKRKFSSELDQVRSVVRRLEKEEVMISGRPSAGGAVGYGGLSQYSMDDNRALNRVHSDVGSEAQYNSRPFQPLSVSVMENSHGIGDLAEKRTPMGEHQNSELLGKIPEVSSRKWKPQGGKRKRKVGNRLSADKYISRSFKGSGDLLTRLMKHKHGWLFDKPVDVEAFKLKDYHDIIKKPMDLGTIKAKLSKYVYNSPMEFAEDIRLTFSNAMTYNPKGHEVHNMAEELLKIFESKWPSIESDYNKALKIDKVRDMGYSTPTPRPSYEMGLLPTPRPSYEMGLLPTPTSRPRDFGLPTPTSRQRELLTPTSRPRELPTPTSRPRELPTPTSRPFIPEPTVLLPFEPRVKPNGGVGRTPSLKKPKARDPYKRDMTFDEKQKLSAELQDLPSEKLIDIVKIIKKRNTALSQHDDEIEVDIDSVDAETLWELDRFVQNFKKNMSKKKKRAEIVLGAGIRATPVPTAGLTPITAELLNHPKRGEKGPVLSLSDQGDREGDGAGLSNSSSSSSSGSGSSSSDSDSDSSSSNGSQGGRSPKT